MIERYAPSMWVALGHFAVDHYGKPKQKQDHWPLVRSWWHVWRELAKETA